MMAKYDILLVEDAPEVQLIVRSALGLSYSIITANSIQEARRILQANQFNVILLDVSLPDGDGFSFCSQIKLEERWSTVPIIFLTGRSETEDKVLGFTLGAEDYIVKPINIPEFKARIESKMRRLTLETKREESFVLGVFRVNSLTQKVYLVEAHGESDLGLTTNEFKMFVYFLRHDSHVLSRDQILDRVWGHDANVTDRTIDTHVYTLRKKLGTLGHFIEAVPRIGYRFSQKEFQPKSKVS